MTGPDDPLLSTLASCLDTQRVCSVSTLLVENKKLKDSAVKQIFSEREAFLRDFKSKIEKDYDEFMNQERQNLSQDRESREKLRRNQMDEMCVHIRQQTLLLLQNHYDRLKEEQDELLKQQEQHIFKLKLQLDSEIQELMRNHQTHLKRISLENEKALEEEHRKGALLLDSTRDYYQKQKQLEEKKLIEDLEIKKQEREDLLQKEENITSQQLFLMKRKRETLLEKMEDENQAVLRRTTLDFERILREKQVLFEETSRKVHSDIHSVKKQLEHVKSNFQLDVDAEAKKRDSEIKRIELSHKKAIDQLVAEHDNTLSRIQSEMIEKQEEMINEMQINFELEKIQKQDEIKQAMEKFVVNYKQECDAYVAKQSNLIDDESRAKLRDYERSVIRDLDVATAELRDKYQKIYEERKKSADQSFLMDVSQTVEELKSVIATGRNRSTSRLVGSPSLGNSTPISLEDTSLIDFNSTNIPTSSKFYGKIEVPRSPRSGGPMSSPRVRPPTNLSSSSKFGYL
ncbi:hypothetical protein RCL1_001606 [Eukaryota sp. TZLM3-RCL]